MFGRFKCEGTKHIRHVYEVFCGFWYDIKENELIGESHEAFYCISIKP